MSAPEYLDVRAVMEVTGKSRDTAYKIMRGAGIVDLSKSGIRVLLVKRDDLETFLEKHRVPR